MSAGIGKLSDARLLHNERRGGAGYLNHRDDNLSKHSREAQAARLRDGRNQCVAAGRKLW